MSPIKNFEQHSRHLIEPDLPIQTRLQMAMEVRDSLEITHTGEYLNFLKCYFRAFSAILYHITKPQFADNPEHKLRNIVVEILNRLPHSEVLRPFVQELLKVAMHALTTDNEENGLICIRIIFDLLRNFRPTLENEVQPFLDFVCRIYQNFRATVTYFFESGAVSAPVAVLGSMSSSTLSSSVGGEDVRPMELSDPICPSAGYVGQLNPSTRSFKIVTESPLVVMFLFQLYGRLVQINIPHLLPLMVAAISVPGPEKVPPHLKTHFIELKGAQVKDCQMNACLKSSVNCTPYSLVRGSGERKHVISAFLIYIKALSNFTSIFCLGLSFLTYLKPSHHSRKIPSKCGLFAIQVIGNNEKLSPSSRYSIPTSVRILNGGAKAVDECPDW
ncbi:unnamed protein product [Ilex paraguariensis]|uniref:Transformation/transcription domain-associated protein n=1 Tax=Ilex paraguariensis TaxID=185542 RepID=A0ABC8RTJ0_9AQUA